jgi:hypothetical protein
VSEINAPVTFTFPSSTLSFNPVFPGTADYYWLTNVVGLDQAPLRVTQDDKPQAPGAILHTSIRGPRHITIEGLVVANSSVANRNTKCDSLRAALEAIENADGTWAWTPTGQTSHSVTVRCDIPIVYSGGQGGGPKSFIFGLVAANPTITIAS